MQQFKGFKPEAMQRIAGTLGYQGDMQGFNQYLNQNPDKMQQMGMYQQKALQMVNGGMVQNFANGGDVDYSQYFDQEGRLRNSDGSLVPTFSQTRPDATTPASTVPASGSNLPKAGDFAASKTSASTTPQMGTGDPQSDTYQDSLGPAAVDKKSTLVKDSATSLVDPRLEDTQLPKDTTTVTPAQTRVDTLAGAKAKETKYTTGQEAFKPVDTTTTTPVDTAITPAVEEEEKEPDYSTFFDDAGNERNMDGSLVTEGKEFRKITTYPTVFNTADNSYSLSSYDSGTDDGIIYTLKDSTGRPLETEFKGMQELLDWAKANNATGYDPKQGAPKMAEDVVEPVMDETIFDAEAYMDANPEVRASYEATPPGRTPYESYVRYGKDQGKEFPIDEVKLKELYPEYATAKKAFESNQDTYRKYITDESAKGVTTDIENIEEEYNKTVKNIQSKKLEVSRLTALAKKDPDTTLLDDEGKPQLDEDGNEIKVNSYYQELLDNKVEELADDMERQADLAPVYQSTQRTVKDLTKERFQDPASAITEEAGTKVMADKIKVEDNQFIKEGTGQLDSVAQGVTSDAKSFDASGPDTVSEQTYDGEEVTDTAEEKLKKLEAQTQDTLTREVVGQTDTIRSLGQADDAIKVAANRIERAVNPIDLEVTANQLAEVKGKDRVAIEANIAVSDRLKKIVAQTSVVDPKELPPPAKISDSIMRSVQAMKETDTGLSGETTDYIAAKMEAFTVSSGTLAVAMQGDVTAQATVQGQLSSLMKSFDNGTPAWAAGAIRAANEAMLSRGMAASSMAAAAIVQAAMESALPIAQQDAQVYAAMGMANLDNQQKVSLANAAAQQGLSLQNLSNEQQMNLQNSVQAFDLQKVNLSNRQSVELANAQIRTSLQGKVLDNTQQSNIITAARYAEQANINLSNKQQAVLQDNVGALQTNLADASAKQQSYITSANLASALQGQVLTNDQQVAISRAARYSDAANLNFTSDQQEVLHNSSLMQSIGLAELNTTQAATLQNAANFANMDMAELSNAQQAQVLNAQNFLQLDLANLSNEQQVAIFKAQAVQQTLLSDQASVNASEQFNATSEMQVDQFNANLKTQVDQFNKAQQTAISQFNAGQDNAMEQFNVAQSNAADQFNAQNELVIAQSNATWRREVATADTAAQNRANEINAKNTLDIQNQAYDNMWQHYGDQMDNAYKSAENEADRTGNYAIAQLSATSTANEAAALRNAGASKSIGSLAATLLTSDLSKGILGSFGLGS